MRRAIFAIAALLLIGTTVQAEDRTDRISRCSIQTAAQPGVCCYPNPERFTRCEHLCCCNQDTCVKGCQEFTGQRYMECVNGCNNGLGTCMARCRGSS